MIEALIAPYTSQDICLRALLSDFKRSTFLNSQFISNEPNQTLKDCKLRKWNTDAEAKCCVKYHGF